MRSDHGEGLFRGAENCGGAPDDNDFALPPLVPANQRRGHGRPRGSRGRPLHTAAPLDAPDVADVAPVSGGAVRRARGRAAAARTVDLAFDVTPLARHVRVQAVPAQPRRELDDANDVVDGTDDDDDSADSEGGDSDDGQDAPERGEDFAAAFVADAWEQVACEGVDTPRAPMPDSPLDLGSSRSAHLGGELPPFSRQEQRGGCIRSHIDAKIGRGCTSTIAFVKLLFTLRRIFGWGIASALMKHAFHGRGAIGRAATTKRNRTSFISRSSCATTVRRATTTIFTTTVVRVNGALQACLQRAGLS